MCECMDGGVDGLMGGWMDGKLVGVYVCSWVWVWECGSMMIDEEEEMSYWMQGDL